MVKLGVNQPATLTFKGAQTYCQYAARTTQKPAQPHRYNADSSKLYENSDAWTYP